MSVTCKDCAIRKKCPDKIKPLPRRELFDTWSYYCIDFVPKRRRKAREVRYEGFIAIQTYYYDFVLIYDEYSQEEVCYIQTEKRLNRRKLKKIIRNYKERLK